MRQLLLVLGVLGAFVAAPLTAQPPTAKPGPEHDMLKEAVGTWDATAKSMGSESKGVLHCKMGLNGLWMLEHYEGDLGKGLKFEGHGATSYDAGKKKYVNVWIDSMVTRPMLTEGTYDKDKKTLTLIGDMPSPDGKTTKAHLTITYNDANTKVMSLRVGGDDGKELEMIEITYKRRSK